ncbi:hypothetical protein [Nonomuraea sp. LPB2021202275-12-8]|uniref:hypothetical protein n=1 Tax=Nonomuraea sp. LPB2021202275-12-8 TaxID=3120159 RepID=UPI00300C6C23
MTILANHHLADDVRALADQLGEARYYVSVSKVRTGLVHAKLRAVQGTTTAAEVYIDTDDGQLLGTVLPKDKTEAWGASDALTLLGTLVPDTAAPNKAKAAPKGKARRATSRTA